MVAYPTHDSMWRQRSQLAVGCRCLAACLLWACLQQAQVWGKDAAAPEQQRKAQTYVRFKDVLQPPSNYFNPVTAYFNMWCAPLVPL